MKGIYPVHFLWVSQGNRLWMTPVPAQANPKPAERSYSSRGWGHEMESWVSLAYRKRGFSIAARNWHFRGGEIDLCVERGGEAIFVEVRARHTSPAEWRSVFPPQKLNHYLRGIALYEEEHRAQVIGLEVVLLLTTRTGVVLHRWDWMTGEPLAWVEFPLSKPVDSCAEHRRRKRLVSVQ